MGKIFIKNLCCVLKASIITCAIAIPAFDVVGFLTSHSYFDFGLTIFGFIMWVIGMHIFGGLGLMAYAIITTGLIVYKKATWVTCGLTAALMALLNGFAFAYMHPDTLDLIHTQVLKSDIIYTHDIFARHVYSFLIMGLLISLLHWRYIKKEFSLQINTDASSEREVKNA
jgi:hypothetical protein